MPRSVVRPCRVSLQLTVAEREVLRARAAEAQVDMSTFMRFTVFGTPTIAPASQAPAPHPAPQTQGTQAADHARAPVSPPVTVPVKSPANMTFDELMALPPKPISKAMQRFQAALATNPSAEERIALRDLFALEQEEEDKANGVST